MLNFLLGLLLGLNSQCEMTNTEKLKNGGVQDSVKISLHNHLFLDRDYNITNIVDEMIKKDLKVITMDSYEMPDIVSDPYLDLTKIIERDSLLKLKYEIGFFDSLALKLTDKEKNKSVYIMNSREVQTKENAHVEFIGYNRTTRYGKPMEELINEGLEAGAIVSICHPFVCEENLHKFWSNERFIGKERKELLEKMLEKYQGRICIEEFNAFIIPLIPKIIDMSEGNKKAEKFLGEMNCGIKLTKVYANDSHVKRKSLLGDIATVYLKMAANEIDTSNGEKIRESMKKNLFEGKYTPSDKKYISKEHFLQGFVTDKLRSYWYGFSSKFSGKRKRMGR